MDFYEADSRPIQHYIDWIRNLPGKKGTIWLPHDARAKSLQTGKSQIEQFLENGIQPRLVPELSVLDGIEATRLTLPLCYFDQARCYDGIEHLRGYMREWDEKNQVYRSRPKHDSHSHASDAFRYLSLATTRRIGKKIADLPQKEVNIGAETPKYGFCLEDIWDCGPRQSTRIG